MLCTDSFQRMNHVFCERLKSKLPLPPKVQHGDACHACRLGGLPKNTYIFYFASRPRDPFLSFVHQNSAYRETDNYGIAKTNSNGKATIFLQCPQVYILGDTVHPRHFHFILWKENHWDTHTLYTQPIQCIYSYSSKTPHIVFNNRFDSVEKYSKKKPIIVVGKTNLDIIDMTHTLQKQGYFNLFFLKHLNERMKNVCKKG